MKKLLLYSVLLSFYFMNSFSVQAQQDDESLFANDMLKVAGDFAAPAAEGAAYQAGAGWFSSAKSLEPWGVEFSVHANVLFIPKKKKNQVVSSNDYDTFNIRGGENATVPTAFGGKTDVIFEGNLNYKGINIPFAFQAFEGIEKNVVPHPFLQATVGLPMSTNFTARYLPEIMVDGVQFSTYGAGLKHNFNQYFRASYPSSFQLAALIAYSKFDVNYEYPPVTIEQVVMMDAIAVDADLWLFQLIGSKSFIDSNWEVFGALGVTNSSFAYTIGGNGFALPKINTALERLSDDEMGFKGDLGFNYRAGWFKLSSMLSVGKFINYNLGLHFIL